MAWEWSHTPEAYEDAYNNLHALPRNQLRTIYAEWKVKQRCGSMVVGAYYTERHKTRRMSEEAMADQIWEWASEQRTCDNGGHNAWVCPFGCHTVPFDREEQP